MTNLFVLPLLVLRAIWGLMRFPFYLRHKNRGPLIGKFLLVLGPAFIKFAQLLSTRPDLIGRRLACNLRVIQDDMPSFSTKDIDKTFLKSFGFLPKALFLEFEYKPLAAASIAQVHKARKKDGSIWAVKVLRPKIKQKINRNIRELEFVVKIFLWLFPKNKNLRLPEVLVLLQHNLLHETDLTIEAANASRLKKTLINDYGIYIPVVDWVHTRPQILTIEYIDSKSLHSTLSEIETLVDTNLAHKRRCRIVHNLVYSFCNQAYRDGVFHADMHPGNIFIDKKDRIILIDFGIVGVLEAQTKFYVSEILRGFLSHDYELVAKIHYIAGYVDHSQNFSEFENACRAIGEPIVGKKLADVNISQLFSGLLKLVHDFKMHTRLELLLVQKATFLLESVAGIISKEANIWEISKSWLDMEYLTGKKVLKRKLFAFFDSVFNHSSKRKIYYHRINELNVKREETTRSGRLLKIPTTSLAGWGALEFVMVATIGFFIFKIVVAN